MKKIAAIYQYLASTTRYVSIQLGIGGLQPIAAADVNRTGFGDCKGLSNYMRAMLTELGIPSVYTVISTTNRRLLADFASANQNNHVILQVPLSNDTLWLECTNPTLPLGYVHHSIAGHDALLVGPNGGTLCQLPTYADSLNTQVNNTLVTLQPDGNAKVEVKQTSRLFQYEDMASIIDMEPARQKDWLRSDINLGYRLKSMPSVPTKSSRKSLNWISRTPSKANNMETKPENACLSRSISSTEAFTVRTTRRTHSKHSNQFMAISI